MLGEPEAIYHIEKFESQGEDQKQHLRGLTIPTDVLTASGLTARELLVELAVHLFEEKLISFGKAKELAGMDSWRFMRLLRSRKIAMHYDVEELKDDMDTLERLGLLIDE